MPTVQVDGVGSFEVRKRTVRVVVGISAEYNRLTEGAEEISSDFGWLCSFLSYLKGMIVSGPEGWVDPYEVDPEDEAAMAVLHKVYAAIKENEGRFRGEPEKEPKTKGAGA